jgi:hypothetical protein
VSAIQFDTEPTVGRCLLSDENCLDDHLLEFAFKTSAVNDARPVRVIVERSIEAEIFMALRAFRASIRASLSASAVFAPRIVGTDVSPTNRSSRLHFACLAFRAFAVRRRRSASGTFRQRSRACSERSSGVIEAQRILASSTAALLLLLRLPILSPS